MPETYGSLQRQRKGLIRGIQRYLKQTVNAVLSMVRRTNRFLSRKQMLTYQDAKALAEDWKNINALFLEIYKQIVVFSKYTQI